MGAIVRIRVTEQTKDIAHAAAQTGERIELRDRHGVLHKGRVVGDGVEYEFGIDQGWFIWFEHEGDFTTQDIIARMLALHEKGIK
jgi:hypothetical protein